MSGEAKLALVTHAGSRESQSSHLSLCQREITTEDERQHDALGARRRLLISGGKLTVLRLLLKSEGEAAGSVFSELGAEGACWFVSQERSAAWPSPSE